MADKQQHGLAVSKVATPSTGPGSSRGGDQGEREPPVRSGEQFDGGSDEDEHTGAGFGEGDDARRVRESRRPPEPD